MCNFSDVFEYCKELGCCKACCLRYARIRNKAYENRHAGKPEVKDSPVEQTDSKDEAHIEKGESDTPGGTDQLKMSFKDDQLENTASPVKKPRTSETCVVCLGILQEDMWEEWVQPTIQELHKKQYSSPTFACALSAPIATILREKILTLKIAHKFPHYELNDRAVTSLKESWKWSFGAYLGTRVSKALDSGAVAPLLITFTMHYSDEAEELEMLKTLSPELFKSRSRQKRRFTVEFTRRAVEQSLQDVSVEALASMPAWQDGMKAVYSRLTCRVHCEHAPLYLAGRYIKLSRSLPQTPWILHGRRMMDSSVQEIIFGPVADAFNIAGDGIESSIKLLSGGREDVDVRCGGRGRPFAIEIVDPPRELTADELSHVCQQISLDGRVLVNTLVHINKEDLAELKKGEETKCKVYNALCIKLTHSEHDAPTNGTTPVKVTKADIENINTYRNTTPTEPARVLLSQSTPVRVLHRRPALTRQRRILDLRAELVPDHPQLFTVRVRTEAGTYVKEWVHGELGRTSPSLGDAMRARVDILALDVASVELDWPPTKQPQVSI